MHDTEVARPVDQADTAAEAIRGLNHATLWRNSPDTYTWPSDVDATVAALETLVQRLPQALTQAAAWLRNAHQAGTVGHDQTRDPNEVAESVNTLTVLLQFAAARAETLAADLAGIHQETAHLTGYGPRVTLDTDEIDGDGDEG